MSISHVPEPHVSDIGKGEKPSLATLKHTHTLATIKHPFSNEERERLEDCSNNGLMAN